MKNGVCKFQVILAEKFSFWTTLTICLCHVGLFSCLATAVTKLGKQLTENEVVSNSNKILNYFSINFYTRTENTFSKNLNISWAFFVLVCIVSDSCRIYIASPYIAYTIYHLYRFSSKYRTYNKITSASTFFPSAVVVVVQYSSCNPF